jgi:serine/threonine protein kinase
MRSLTALLREQGAMNVLTVGLYLDQIASALEYAHQHATIHRGLTTDTIFIRNDGGLVITDLGVMRILALTRPANQQVLLYGNSPVSAPAPEQLLGQAVHTYTDVYGLGAMLYRLLSGHRVFSASSRDDLIQQHLHAPVPSLTKWRQITIGERDVTAELDDLLARAMAKDPTQRIQHPGELANSYHQIVAPDDRARQPITVPQPDVAALPAPMPIAATALKSARMPQGVVHRAAVTPSRSAQINGSRRRMLLLLGGGGAVVAVGAVGLIVEQLLNKSTPSTVTCSPSSVPATSSSGGQSSTTSSQPTQSTPTRPSSPGHTGTVIARVADVPLNGAKTFPLPSGGANPGILVHLQDGKFVAFDTSCTHHSECSVAYDAQAKLLVCPCHWAEFDPANSASVVQGPAKSPLAPVQITVNADGTITVR